MSGPTSEPGAAAPRGRWIAPGLLAMWLGGLTFYAGAVVPIGSAVLGSHRAFGFITRQVTVSLNAAASAVLLVLLIELLRARRRGGGRGVLPVTFGIMAACQVALWFLHPWLDALLDPAARTIADPDAFYLRHRSYLWTSALQWLAGVVHYRALVR